MVDCLDAIFGFNVAFYEVDEFVDLLELTVGSLVFLYDLLVDLVYLERGEEIELSGWVL